MKQELRSIAIYCTYAMADAGAHFCAQIADDIDKAIAHTSASPPAPEIPSPNLLPPWPPRQIFQGAAAARPPFSPTSSPGQGCTALHGSRLRIPGDEAEATAAGGVDGRLSRERANERALERVFAAGCRPPAVEGTDARTPLCFRPFFPYLSVQCSVANLETEAEWLEMAHTGTKPILL